MPIYYLPDGTPALHPTSKADAKKKRSRLYTDGNVCSACGITALKHTASDRCMNCAKYQAQHLFNLAVGVGYITEDEKGLHMVLMPTPTWKPFPGKDYLTPENYDELSEAMRELGYSGNLREPINVAQRMPANALEATQWGRDQYVRGTPCGAWGHLGVMNRGGTCAACDQRLEARRSSPRKRALAAGERWYTPTESCAHCGERAPRRVDNGRCECTYPNRGPTEARLLMATAPDLIMTRNEAEQLGLSVYQPTAGTWRYTCSGNRVRGG